MPKTDANLREDKSVFSMLEEYGAWAVVVGVVAEVVHAWIFRHGKSPWEWLTPVAASALIALGVIVEIVCAGKALEASDELDRRSEERVAAANARASEADARAAEAQLALEVLKSPRYLKADQYLRVLETVKPFAGTKFALAMHNAPEPATFMTQIEALLMAAGWLQEPWKLGDIMYDRPDKPHVGFNSMSGVLVQADISNLDKVESSTRTLVAALHAEGIFTKGEIGVLPAAMDKAVINITIGEKPA